MSSAAKGHISTTFHQIHEPRILLWGTNIWPIADVRAYVFYGQIYTDTAGGEEHRVSVNLWDKDMPCHSCSIIVLRPHTITIGNQFLELVIGRYPPLSAHIGTCRILSDIKVCINRSRMTWFIKNGIVTSWIGAEWWKEQFFVSEIQGPGWERRTCHFRWAFGDV